MSKTAKGKDKYRRCNVFMIYYMVICIVPYSFSDTLRRFTLKAKITTKHANKAQIKVN